MTGISPPGAWDRITASGIARPGLAGEPALASLPGAAARLLAVVTALGLLERFQAEVLVAAWCPECANPVFADAEVPLFTCGYCGHGPFGAGE